MLELAADHLRQRPETQRDLAGRFTDDRSFMADIDDAVAQLELDHQVQVLFLAEQTLIRLQQDTALTPVFDRKGLAVDDGDATISIPPQVTAFCFLLVITGA